MKAVVLEIRDTIAAVLLDDGRMCKVLNQQYAIGQVIEMKEQTTIQTPKRRPLVWAASIAAVVLLAGGGSWAWATPYSYVSMDVNPSVEYTLNRFDRVLTVKGVNEDGKDFVEEFQLENLGSKSIDEALAQTVERIGEKGYFDGEDSALVITTSSKDLKKAATLAEQLEKKADEGAGDREVEIEAESVGLERVEEARALGVTPGKLNLVEKLRESAANPEDIDLEEWLNKSVKEIQQATKENREAQKVQEQAGKDAEKAEQAQEKAADKVEKEAEKAQQTEDKAADKVEKEAEKAQQTEDKVADKAGKEAEKAQQTEDKAADKAEKETEKAQQTEDKVADKAEKDAEKAEKENGSQKAPASDKQNNGKGGGK